MSAPSAVVKSNFVGMLPGNYPIADPADSASAVKYGDATQYTNVDGSKMFIYVTQADPVLADLTGVVTYYKQIINTAVDNTITSVVLKVVTLKNLPSSGPDICGMELYQYYTHNIADDTYTLTAEYALKLYVNVDDKTATISSAVWSAAAIALAKPSVDAEGDPVAAVQPEIDADNGLLGLTPPANWDEVGQVALGSANPFPANMLVSSTGMLFNFDDLAGSPSTALLTAASANPATGTLEPTEYYSFVLNGIVWQLSTMSTVAPTLNDDPTPYVVKQNGVYTITMPDHNGEQGVSASFTAKVYITETANFSEDDNGAVQLSGPVIIQLTTAIVPYDEPSDDAECLNIIAKIAEINAEAVNFGTLTNYQGIINAVNNYVANVDAQNVTLSAANVASLTAYATNISSVSNLFGQLVVNLQTSHNVDSSALISSISDALDSIATGIKNMQAFKLAISQQNQFKISTCMINMNGYLSSLTQKYSLLDNDISDGDVDYKVIDTNAPISKLFKLNESVNYFAAGMPAVAFSTGVSPNVIEYVKTFTGNNGATPVVDHYIRKSWYTDNFSMSADDVADLEKATALVNSYNATLSTTLDQVYTDSNIDALNTSLAVFSGYSSALSAAHNRLLYQLGVMGFNLKFN